MQQSLKVHDTALILIMGVLAACGLIYEYLLSHYAGRVLGAIETTLYAMIGLMIVAMGIGAFLARIFKSPFTAFAWLEVSIACLGAVSILIVGALVAVTYLLPSIIIDTFNLPPDFRPQNEIYSSLQTIAAYSPFVMGFILGLLIGMEIPLIARVREVIHQKHLVHNTGTIYGADYIGAGFGAVIWISLLIVLDISTAAAWVASVNIIAGLAFWLLYRNFLRRPWVILAAHGLAIVLVIFIGQFGEQWNRYMNRLLYVDEVVFDKNTRYQHLTLTRKVRPNGKPSIYKFYINGRLQFSSHDEHIYHTMLVHPTLLSTPDPERVLIVGGGDGLALREALRWPLQSVDLIDLDPDLVALFRKSSESVDGLPQKAMSSLNKESFDDPRVSVIFADAFTHIDQLINEDKRYQAIIVDLPDPSHPDLNRLYSDNFYARLKQLLTGDGVMVVQSTSPYHAKDAFLSIGLTLELAGFENVQQYHQNIPSFGQWGFSIGVVQGASVRRRLDAVTNLPFNDKYLSLELIKAAFVFPKEFFKQRASVRANPLGSYTTYRYHHQAWQEDEGLFTP